VTLPVAALGLGLAAAGLFGLRRSRRPDEDEQSPATAPEPAPQPPA
jgi:hypothetical protein